MCRAAADWWQQQGVQVVEDQPDLTDAAQVFHVSVMLLITAVLVRDGYRKHKNKK